MSKSLEQEIRERLAAATPGPWTDGPMPGVEVRAADGAPAHWRGMKIVDIRGWGHLTGHGALGLGALEAEAWQEANAAFIANAPTDIAYLLAENERLRAIAHEAIELADEGWAYASDYFRKRRDCDGEMEKLRNAIDGGGS